MGLENGGMNHISSAIFSTDPEGRKTVQTWVYSVLFLICLILSWVIIVSGTSCQTTPADTKREVRLALQMPSSVHIIADNGELQVVEIIQKEVKACPCPCPSPISAMRGSSGMACPPCPPCPPTGPPMQKSPNKGCGPNAVNPGNPGNQQAPAPRMPSANIRP